LEGGKSREGFLKIGMFIISKCGEFFGMGEEEEKEAERESHLQRKRHNLGYQGGHHAHTGGMARPCY